MNYTPDKQINPDSFYDDSDEVMIKCDRCDKEHSIHNSNSGIVLTDEGQQLYQYCNGCKNKFK